MAFKRKYSIETLKEAIKVSKENPSLSVLSIAHRYSVAEATLRRHVKNKKMRLSRVLLLFLLDMKKKQWFNPWIIALLLDSKFPLNVKKTAIIMLEEKKQKKQQLETNGSDCSRKDIQKLCLRSLRKVDPKEIKCFHSNH